MIGKFIVLSIPRPSSSLVWNKHVFFCGHLSFSLKFSFFFLSLLIMIISIEWWCCMRAIQPLIFYSCHFFFSVSKKINQKKKKATFNEWTNNLLKIGKKKTKKKSNLNFFTIVTINVRPLKSNNTNKFEILPMNFEEIRVKSVETNKQASISA